MTAEKVTVQQAIQRLAETNNSNDTRLTSIENKLTEINVGATEKNTDVSNNLSSQMSYLQSVMTNQIENIQSQTQKWQDSTKTKLEENQEKWIHLTSDFLEIKSEITKICEFLTMNQTRKIDNNQPTENNSFTRHTDHNPSTANELFDDIPSFQPNMTRRIHHAETNSSQSSSIERIAQATHTIIIPPPSSVPIFSGIISENPRQFLIRLKEYAETTNNWNDQSLLNGVSQFLRDTALEWYCQLRTSHRRPQTWIDFVGLFLNQFNSPMRRARQEEQWKNCKQEENETINEFIVRLRALWTEQKPNETENDLVRHLLCKMRNNLLTMIGVSRTETLDEILLEAQKIEEILYQRSKQQQQRQYNSFKQEPHRTYTSSTPTYHDNNELEEQAMSTHQTSRPSYTQTKKYYTARNHDNNFKTSHYPNDSSFSTYNRQYNSWTNDVKCYTCGMKGHVRKNCPGQYNRYQQQQSWYYPKNDNGARDGRDYDAPM